VNVFGLLFGELVSLAFWFSRCDLNDTNPVDAFNRRRYALNTPPIQIWQTASRREPLGTNPRFVPTKFGPALKKKNECGLARLSAAKHNVTHQDKGTATRMNAVNQ
jgi:hypothetical protein